MSSSHHRTASRTRNINKQQQQQHHLQQTTNAGPSSTPNDNGNGGEESSSSPVVSPDGQDSSAPNRADDSFYAMIAAHFPALHHNATTQQQPSTSSTSLVPLPSTSSSASAGLAPSMPTQNLAPSPLPHPYNPSSSTNQALTRPPQSQSHTISNSNNHNLKYQPQPTRYGRVPVPPPEDELQAMLAMDNYFEFPSESESDDEDFVPHWAKDGTGLLNDGEWVDDDDPGAMTVDDFATPLEASGGNTGTGQTPASASGTTAARATRSRTQQHGTAINAGSATANHSPWDASWTPNTDALNNENTAQHPAWQIDSEEYNWLMENLKAMEQTERQSASASASTPAVASGSSTSQMTGYTANVQPVSNMPASNSRPPIQALSPGRNKQALAVAATDGGKLRSPKRQQKTYLKSPARNAVIGSSRNNDAGALPASPRTRARAAAVEASANVEDRNTALPHTARKASTRAVTEDQSGRQQLPTSSSANSRKENAATALRAAPPAMEAQTWTDDSESGSVFSEDDEEEEEDHEQDEHHDVVQRTQGEISSRTTKHARKPSSKSQLKNVAPPSTGLPQPTMGARQAPELAPSKAIVSRANRKVDHAPIASTSAKASTASAAPGPTLSKADDKRRRNAEQSRVFRTRQKLRKEATANRISSLEREAKALRQCVGELKERLRRYEGDDVDEEFPEIEKAPPHAVILDDTGPSAYNEGSAELDIEDYEMDRSAESLLPMTLPPLPILPKPSATNGTANKRDRPSQSHTRTASDTRSAAVKTRPKPRPSVKAKQNAAVQPGVREYPAEARSPPPKRRKSLNQPAAASTHRDVPYHHSADVSLQPGDETSQNNMPKVPAGLSFEDLGKFMAGFLQSALPQAQVPVNAQLPPQLHQQQIQQSQLQTQYDQSYDLPHLSAPSQQQHSARASSETNAAAMLAQMMAMQARN